MKENFKCWIFGNLVTLNAGCFAMIFILSNIYYKFLKVPANYSFYIAILLIPPFLCALVLKYIKRDSSFLWYSSTGWLYALFFMFFLKYFPLLIENFPWRDTFGEDLFFTFSFTMKYFFLLLPHSPFILLYRIILPVILASLAGGVVIEIVIICLREKAKILSSERNLTIICCLIPVLFSVIIIITFFIYYYAPPQTSPGWVIARPQKDYNLLVDNLLRDLRALGSGVSPESCGVKKEDSIKEATASTIMFYGDICDYVPGIELVRYYAENKRYLIRILYAQSGTGSDSAWTEILGERVLIGPGFPDLTDIRLAEDPPGFQLSYYTPPKPPQPQSIPVPFFFFPEIQNYSDEEELYKLDSGQIGEEERKQIRYVSVHIVIMYKGKLCMNKYSNPYELRNLDKPK